jgi:hypothetical protein
MHRNKSFEKRSKGMKHIKLFEDYSDEEIEDLIGDLAGVGLAKKWRVVGSIFTVTPEAKYYRNWEEQVHEVFVVEVVADSEKVAYSEAFEKLKSGDFTQKLSEEVPAKENVLNVIPEVGKILFKDNIIKSANGKASQQPMERKDITRNPIYDGKIRWILTVDLVGPTEEEILDKIKSMTGGVVTPEVEGFVSHSVGWNLRAEEI